MGAQTENEDFGFVSHTDVTRSLVPSVAQEMDMDINGRVFSFKGDLRSSTKTPHGYTLTGNIPVTYGYIRVFSNTFG